MWIKQLTTMERRTMGACFGGWGLDALDVQIFSFVIPTLLSLWHITTGGRHARHRHAADLGASAAGSRVRCPIARPRAHPADHHRLVRRCSPSSAVSRRTSLSFSSAARMQGFGFGGEWAAGAVLMGEVMRDRYRGRAVGIVQTGWAFGWGAGGAALHRPVRDLARGNRVARAVLDRHPAGAAGVLDPPLRRGAAKSAQRPAGAGRLRAHVFDAETRLPRDHAGASC